MSWLFSQALAEDYLPPDYLDLEQFVQLKMTHIVKEFSYNGKMMGFSLHSRSGMILEPSQEAYLGDLLILLLRDFLVRHTAQQQAEETISQEISGQTLLEWSMRSDPILSSGRMSIKELLKEPAKILDLWTTPVGLLDFLPRTWVQITHGDDIGFLHTPTTAGNYCCNSMQKHPNCRLFKMVFGETTPEIQEWLMGWPIGWTGLEQLETDRFQLWQSRHFKC